jgi:hypothetical protein
MGLKEKKDLILQKFAANPNKVCLFVEKYFP